MRNGPYAITEDAWPDLARQTRYFDGTDYTPEQADLFRHIVELRIKHQSKSRYMRSFPTDGPLTTDAAAREIVHTFGKQIHGWIKRVPARMLTARLADLRDPAQAPSVVRGFLDSAALTLFLAGPVGTGKSYAAYAVANEASGMWHLPRAWSVPRLLMDLRPDRDRDAFDDACTRTVVVLDDLVAAKPTDWAVEQMYSIAEARVSNGLQTVITTNGTYEDLCSVWGEPTMDRWRDRSVTAALKGESLRKPLW